MFSSKMYIFTNKPSKEDPLYPDEVINKLTKLPEFDGMH
jgi:hypothetical protein